MDAEAKAALIAKAKAAKAAAAAAAPAPAPAAAAMATPPPALKPAVAVAAPAPAAAANRITISLSAKTLAIAFTSLVILVLVLGGLNLYLFVRMGKVNPLDHVVHQPPGLDKNPEFNEKPLDPKDASKKPGASKAPEPDSNEPVEIGKLFKQFEGKPSDIPGSWPTFRGPAYDNISTEAVKLIDQWPASGPKVLWSLDLGLGYAGASIHKGRVYVLDYDETAKEDALRCFSLDDGKEIWRRSYKVMVKQYHGFSRTVPAVTDQFVVTIGPKCHVMCVDAVTGDFKWGIDLVKEYGTKIPEWYTAQCPLIDGTTAVLAPAGPENLMIGVDCATGKVLWKTPNPKGWTMSHASVLPMKFGGRKMYVYPALGGIAGVAADGADVGKVLWESLEWSDKKQVWSSVLVLDDGYVFMTSGFGLGSYLFQVSEQGGAFQTKTIWRMKPDQGVACEQHTPIYYNKVIYSVHPEQGPLKEQLVCMDPYNGGKVLWSSDKTKRYGHYEPFMVADGKLFVLSEEGGLSIVKPSREKFEPLSEAKVLHGHEAWAPIALVGGRMILRDSKKMVCLDVRAGSP